MGVHGGRARAGHRGGWKQQHLQHCGGSLWCAHYGVPMRDGRVLLLSQQAVIKGQQEPAHGGVHPRGHQLTPLNWTVCCRMLFVLFWQSLKCWPFFLLESLSFFQCWFFFFDDLAVLYEPFSIFTI